MLLVVLGTSIPEVELFQIAQTTTAGLRVRLRPAAGADPDCVWRAVHAGIRRLLAEHELDYIAVERAGEPPEQSPGGKYRTIIPLSRGGGYVPGGGARKAFLERVPGGAGSTKSPRREGVPPGSARLRPALGVPGAGIGAEVAPA